MFFTVHMYYVVLVLFHFVEINCIKLGASNKYSSLYTERSLSDSLSDNICLKHLLLVFFFFVVVVVVVFVKVAV